MLEHFQLQKGYHNFNHGSFGAVPKVVGDAHYALLREVEALPDNWFRGGYQAKLNVVRATLAEYVGADPANIVFVENASSGVNSVLRSLAFDKSDKILLL